MPKCIGQHWSIKIGASYGPISAICRSSSLKFCDFLQELLHLVPPHRKWVFWVFLLYLFQQVHAVSEKNITHNSSPFWQGSPFRQENSKKMEMSWNIQGIRIVFFKRLRFASRFWGCWWAHLCPVSDCHRRVARNFCWGSPSNVRFLKGKIWQ